METVSITDYKIVSPTLARVIISYTGSTTPDTIRQAILAKSDNMIAPVENSFRQVKKNVSVGFVRANKEMRYIDDPKELRASYRVMSSNIMMDNNDKSLWEVRTGKGGTFLARHGSEDLSDLIEASINRRTDVPGIRHIAISAAAAGEFASFVGKSGDMDYGFVVKANTTKALILSHSMNTPVVVENSLITALARVPVKKSFAREMAKAGISRADKDQAITFWQKLYSYDPAYLSEVVDQVNEDTTA